MADFMFLNSAWRFRTGTAGTDWTLAGNAGTGAELLGTTNAQPLRIITNGAERARVHGTGQVSIGTVATSGTALLNVSNNVAQQVRVDNPNAADNADPAEIVFARTAVNPTQEAAVGIGGTARDFFVWVNGADRLNISEIGNTGIGVPVPTARLHINGAYANTFTALAAGAAPAIPNNVTHVRLTDNAAVSANAIAGPAAPVDGQVITIVNNDAEAATFAGATIAAATGAASFVYANGAWRVYGNSQGDNLGNHTATTQIQSTLGSAAAPGYSLVGDLNTGLFSPGADQMAVSTAGVERARITAAGHLGLGTAAPTYRVDIANGATGGIRIQDNGFAGFPNGYQYLTIGDDAYFSDVDVANTTALFGLANPDRAGLYLGSSGALVYGINGFIGINNATPQSSLHVTGAYANTFTALAAGATPAIANNVTHVRLTDNAAVSANAIAGPAAPVDGQVITIVNNDA